MMMMMVGSRCVAVAVTFLLCTAALTWHDVGATLTTPGLNQTVNCSSNASREGVEYAQCLDLAPPYEVCPYPELCEAITGDNVGLAFGLTIGAGLATTIGALLPFVPFIKHSNTKYLSGALALAAGVMLYVSFTEIRDKSRGNFCCETQLHFDLAASACFFGGILLTVLLDLLTVGLQKLDCGCRCVPRTCQKKRQTTGDQLSMTNGIPFPKHSSLTKMERLDSNSLILPAETSSEGGSTPTAESLQEGTEVEAEMCPTAEANVHNSEPLQTTFPSDVDSRIQNSDGISVSMVSNTLSDNTNNLVNASVNELFSNSSLLRMNTNIPEATSISTSAEVKSYVDSISHVSLPMNGDVVMRDVGGGEETKQLPTQKNGLIRRNSYQEMVDQEDFEPQGPSEFREVTEVVVKDTKRLHRMGILTGLAIGIHNFPEGLATFVATLSSPSLGVALAIAIALHNIPEGVCVAMPVYYATGSKWRGFLWAFLSGISEPFGALMGWLVLRDHFGPLVYGISFGIIAGMMVFISLKELLPMAYKFDHTRSHVVIPIFLVVGMVVMAASLLLFLY